MIDIIVDKVTTYDKDGEEIKEIVCVSIYLFTFRIKSIVKSIVYQDNKKTDVFREQRFE